MPVGEQTAKVIRGNDLNRTPMDSDRQAAHIKETQCGQRGQSEAHASRRLMHQSTLTLGDTASAPCYTTTHAQSYSGRAANGQPLIFHLRDPSFPSQHLSRLNLSTTTPCPSLSHTKEVHGPKDVTPRANVKLENWARYCGGQAVSEIANPRGPTPYRTTYGTEYRQLAAAGSPHWAGGRPTPWHEYDILTGEQRQPAGPGIPSRRSGDRELWATRRWEADCSALRLY